MPQLIQRTSAVMTFAATSCVEDLVYKNSQRHSCTHVYSYSCTQILPNVDYLWNDTLISGAAEIIQWTGDTFNMNLD